MVKLILEVSNENDLELASGRPALLEASQLNLSAEIPGSSLIIVGEVAALLACYKKLEQLGPLYIAVRNAEATDLSACKLLQALAPLLQIKYVTNVKAMAQALDDSFALFSGSILWVTAEHEVLWQKFNIADVFQFIRLAKKNNILSFIGGDLELADVSRLLPYNPDFLILKPGLFVENVEKLLSISATPRVIRPQDMLKLHVRDYIVDMNVGVYSHEYAAKQRLCFNVVVDAITSCGKPQHISDIFSYDLILDAIKDLTTYGHVDFVETLAQELCERLLCHAMVLEAQVRVEKLDLAAKAVGVEVRRVKSNAAVDIAEFQI